MEYVGRCQSTGKLAVDINIITVQYILDQGFSKEQLNLGMPFYGTYMEGRMEQYIYNGKDKTVPDAWTNMVNWEGIGDIYFNSPAMLKDKTAYALYSEIGGIMIFSLYCDIPYEDQYSMTRALREILDDRLEIRE